jgi:hypothetical protein
METGQTGDIVICAGLDPSVEDAADGPSAVWVDMVKDVKMMTSIARACGGDSIN